MKTKFLIHIPDGNFGIGGQQLTANDIIILESYTPVPNLDISAELKNTNTKFFDKDVLSIAIEVSGAILLGGVHPVGYNSGFDHNLNIDEYIKTEFRKLDPDSGDPFGGGFHSIETVFGSRNISYLPNEIAFEIEQNDGIIQLNKTYQFNLYFTTNGVGGSDF